MPSPPSSSGRRPPCNESGRAGPGRARGRGGRAIELTDAQKSRRAEFRAFVNAEVAPHADRYDREERIPAEAIRRLAERGYLGAVLPAEVGGAGMDAVTFGLLNEELGRGCSSLRSLLTVHSMVARTLLRWGSAEQRRRWLAPLGSGATVAAFALSEPDVGSDAGSVETEATLSGDSYVLKGRKKWISFGQVADLFLLFARTEERPAVFLVEAGTPGLRAEPITGMLGLRGSMLAELHLDGCRVPKENLVGRTGFGVTAITTSALEYGRYSVACGCVGIAQACLEACVGYAGERRQFGAYLQDHQLIGRLLTRMIANTKAARLLCYEAGRLLESGDPASLTATAVAKYFASTAAVQAAGDAVQIHGANGCSGDYPVQRLMRDAKIMEIIEGSTQILEVAIARNAQQELAR